MGIFLLIILVTTYRKILSYDLTCPHLSLRNLRAKAVCLPNYVFRYACLYDRNNQVMSESCTENPDYSPPGEKYVLYGSRTTVECSEDRFQPLPLWPNVSSRCIFLKSLCNDQGQLLFTKGSTKSDTTCQCDFIKQYDYVNTPKDPCSCVPSQEDCSCYLNTQMQIEKPGYKCTSIDITTGKSTSTTVSSPNNRTGKEGIYFEPAERQRSPTNILVLVCVSLIGIFFPFYLCVKSKSVKREKNLLSSIKSSGPMRNPQVTQKKEEKQASKPADVNVKSSSTVGQEKTIESEPKKTQTEPLKISFKKMRPLTIPSSEINTPSKNTESKLDISTQLVAAIDIGTTSSVYAFYNKSIYGKSDLQTSSVNLNKPWDAGKGGLWSVKTPTCILLNNNLEVIAIGCDAQARYRNYIYGEESKDVDVDDTDIELKGCHFIDKFKMELYNQDFFKEKNFKDVKGKKVAADKVISSMISKLKERLESENYEVSPYAIQWVLTIPAIWTDEAKHFMKCCAYMAGIKENKLSIIVESEAASVYMYHMLRERHFNNVTQDMPSKYLVIDIGGGTCDIAAHRVINGKLMTLYKPCGSDNGGTKVDHLVLERFRNIIGNTAHDQLKTNASYFELLEEFEGLNISSSISGSKKIPCKIPLSALNETCQECLGATFSDVLKELSSGRSKGISLTKDRLRFDRNVIDTLISTVAAGIIEDIRHVLDNTIKDKIRTFFVVGGFSNSSVIQSKLKEAFPDMIIEFPSNAELAVVKGAALYGNDESFIYSSQVTNESNV